MIQSDGPHGPGIARPTKHAKSGVWRIMCRRRPFVPDGRRLTVTPELGASSRASAGLQTDRLVLAAVAHVPPAMLRGSLISRHPIRPRRLRARLVVPAPHCRQRVQHVGPVNQARCDQRGAGLGGTVGGPDQVFAPIVHQDPRTDGEGQAELLGADRNATTPASVLVSQMPRPAWPNAAACAAIAEGWQAPSSS